MAAANETRFFINAGLGHVSYRPVREISSSSGVVPGAGSRVEPHVSVIVDGGMFIADNWSLAVSSGLPPTIRISGTGTTAGLGELGKASYGSTIFLIQRHFPIRGAVTPYVGAGPAYSLIFSTKGAFARQLRLSDEFGFVLQAGVVVPIARGYGLFVDAKKTFIRSRSRIVIGDQEFTSFSHPNPVTFSGGISYRF